MTKKNAAKRAARAAQAEGGGSYAALRKAEIQRRVDVFNKDVPVGTPVQVKKDDDSIVHT